MLKTALRYLRAGVLVGVLAVILLLTYSAVILNDSLKALSGLAKEYAELLTWAWNDLTGRDT